MVQGVAGETKKFGYTVKACDLSKAFVWSIILEKILTCIYNNAAKIIWKRQFWCCATAQQRWKIL